MHTLCAHLCRAWNCGCEVVAHTAAHTLAVPSLSPLCESPNPSPPPTPRMGSPGPSPPPRSRAPELSLNGVVVHVNCLIGVV